MKAVKRQASAKRKKKLITYIFLVRTKNKLLRLEYLTIKSCYQNKAI